MGSSFLVSVHLLPSLPYFIYQIISTENDRKKPLAESLTDDMKVAFCLSVGSSIQLMGMLGKKGLSIKYFYMLCFKSYLTL